MAINKLRTTAEAMFKLVSQMDSGGYAPHRSVMLEALLGAIVYTILGLATSIYIQKAASR